MQQIVFLNRFFYPDHCATSLLLSDLAFHLAGLGHRIHVIASRQLYDTTDTCLPAQEFINGVQVHRIPTTRFGRSGLLGRSIDYLSYLSSASRCAKSLARPGDIIVAKTDPPLMSMLAMQVVRRTGAQLVNWVQDLHPEAAARMFVPSFPCALDGLITTIRNPSLRGARVNIAVGEHMANKIRSYGIAADRIEVIHNWSTDANLSPVKHGENPLRGEWRLNDKFVVGYSGNLGRAHEFETVLATAEELRQTRDIVFLFIGGGHHFKKLAARVKQRGLDHKFQFRPYQSQELLKYSLGVADIHLVSLRPEFEGLIVPSKFYGAAAAGRPVIAIGSADGEIGRLVKKYEIGITVEQGEAKRLSQELVFVAKNREWAVAAGRRARAMLDTHFSRQHALSRWQEVLEPLIAIPLGRDKAAKKVVADVAA